MFDLRLSAETFSGNTSETSKRQPGSLSAERSLAGSFNDVIQDQIGSPTLFLHVTQVSLAGNKGEKIFERYRTRNFVSKRNIRFAVDIKEVQVHTAHSSAASIFGNEARH